MLYIIRETPSYMTAAEDFLTSSRTQCAPKIHPSIVCWIFLTVMIALYALEIVVVVLANARNRCAPLHTLALQFLSFCVQFLLLVMMYYHCARCNGLVGLFKFVALALLWALVAALLTPRCKEKYTSTW